MSAWEMLLQEIAGDLVSHMRDRIYHGFSLRAGEPERPGHIVLHVDLDQIRSSIETWLDNYGLSPRDRRVLDLRDEDVFHQSVHEYDVVLEMALEESDDHPVKISLPGVVYSFVLQDGCMLSISFHSYLRYLEPGYEDRYYHYVYLERDLAGSLKLKSPYSFHTFSVPKTASEFLKWIHELYRLNLIDHRLLAFLQDLSSTDEVLIEQFVDGKAEHPDFTFIDLSQKYPIGDPAIFHLHPAIEIFWC